MPALKGLEWTFDTVASTYEKLRPGYVEELYKAYLSIFLLMKIVMCLRWEVVADKLLLQC